MKISFILIYLVCFHYVCWLEKSFKSQRIGKTTTHWQEHTKSEMEIDKQQIQLPNST